MQSSSVSAKKYTVIVALLLFFSSFYVPPHQAERVGFWTVLMEVGVSFRSILAVLYCLMERSKPRPLDRICAVQAARLYLTLLQLPRSGGFTLFHPMIFEKTLDAFILFPENGILYIIICSQLCSCCCKNNNVRNLSFVVHFCCLLNFHVIATPPCSVPLHAALPSMLCYPPCSTLHAVFPSIQRSPPCSVSLHAIFD